MKAALIINESAGSEHGEFSAENIKNELTATQIDFDIFNIGIKREAELSLNDFKNKYDAVIAAGGDGTVNYTASIMAGSDIPMGIIPAGTLNHFAKDNNIPLTLKESVEIINKNKVKPVDIASVNGCIFVNNSSIGLYALAVREREKRRIGHGMGKWSAMFAAFIAVFKRFPLYDIEINVNGKIEYFKSPIIFVGNNEYKLDLFSLGTRESLERGILSLYIAKCKTRLGILKLIVNVMFNRLHLSEDFETRLVKEVKIDSKKKGLYAAYDGEVKFIKTPLIYSILPKQINVILP